MKRRRWAALLSALILLCAQAALGEERKTMFEEEWYHQALEASVMSPGNNVRLKRVIARARQGENITLATIGGSITEGAGAGTYPECWASRFRVMFRNAYGSDAGDNVELVNAGVGGTPSPFGYLRYQREVVGRVSAKDADGLPDVVVIEFSVNDWQEPTGHRCYESMVKEILDAPNEPAVILLFAVFRNGFNLQEELKRIGSSYGLMMVSVKDGFYGLFDSTIRKEDFFSDEYHPTSLGHRIYADCLMRGIRTAAEAETDAAPDPDVQPVYGTDFLGLKTIFGDTMHKIQPSNMDANAPWCDAFVDFVILKTCEHFGKGAETARMVLCGDFDDYTYNSVALYKKAGIWFKTPVRGDQIFFGGSGHTGIVTSVNGGTVHTIEGNKGDEVRRGSYSVNSPSIIGYGRPRYDLITGKITAADMPLVKKGSRGEAVKKLQQILNNKGYKLTVDGDFGEKTDAAVRAYQKANHLTVDGEVGEKTWASLL